MTRHEIHVEFDDGDSLETEINGTADEVLAYYFGNEFVGEHNGREWKRRVTKITFYRRDHE